MSDYDNEEVEYCRNCLDLHLIDVKGEPFCMNCGTSNFTQYAPNIFEYKEYVKKVNKGVQP